MAMANVLASIHATNNILDQLGALTVNRAATGDGNILLSFRK